MSWIRLLNTSRSFSPQDSEPRGYRLTQMNLIPKFGNSTRPVPGAARATVPAAPASTTRRIQPLVPLPRAAVSPAPEPPPEPAPAPAPVLALARIQALLSVVRLEPARVINALRAMVAAATELSGRLLRRRDASPFALTGSVRPTVAAQTAQAELRLEAVKPVHNDLSDCDYEVRAMPGVASASSADACPELPSAPERETGVLATAGEALNRVRTLFH